MELKTNSRGIHISYLFITHVRIWMQLHAVHSQLNSHSTHRKPWVVTVATWPSLVASPAMTKLPPWKLKFQCCRCDSETTHICRLTRRVDSFGIIIGFVQSCLYTKRLTAMALIREVKICTLNTLIQHLSHTDGELSADKVLAAQQALKWANLTPVVKMWDISAWTMTPKLHWFPI